MKKRKKEIMSSSTLLCFSEFSNLRDTYCAQPKSTYCACSIMPSPLQPHVAYQAPLPMGFSRQEYWNRLPFPSPRNLPDPGIKPLSPVAPVLAGGIFTTEPPGERKSNLTYEVFKCQ